MDRRKKITPGFNCFFNIHYGIKLGTECNFSHFNAPMEQLRVKTNSDFINKQRNRKKLTPTKLKYYCVSFKCGSRLGKRRADRIWDLDWIWDLGEDLDCCFRPILMSCSHRKKRVPQYLFFKDN